MPLPSNQPFDQGSREDTNEKEDKEKDDEEGEERGGFGRHRISTHTSNISQLESSWEEVTAPKSRTSSTASRYKDRSKKRFKLKFSTLFGHHGSGHGGREEKTEKTPVGARRMSDFEDLGTSSGYGTVPKVEADADLDMELLPPLRLRSPSSSQAVAPRFRLTASESEAKPTKNTIVLPRGRSSSLVGLPPQRKNSANSVFLTKDFVAKKNKKVLSNRSIGIVGGDDFIINPTKSDKFASYLHTQWNNVKYGFHIKSKVHISMKSPIWLLGHCYTVGNDGSDGEKHRLHEEFLADFHSRIWFTYRREFPLLTGSTLTSDCGWGCMLRSGQMMLAQALLIHFLGREWRLSLSDGGSRRNDVYHRQVIRWCGDNQHHDQLFGLHKLVTIGQKNGKRAGDWYGPASLAFILQKAMLMARPANPLLRKMHVYVSRDCTIFRGDVMDMLKDSVFGTPTDADEALIILVPIRLGTGKVNRLYIPCLKDLLTLKYSIGVIGGRPSHSLYFVGWQGDEFITLDPHFCQETVNVHTDRNFNLSSFHCSQPQKLPMTKMDPSCTLGFYCKDLAEFQEFCQTAAEVQSLHCKGFPVFTFSNGRISDYDAKEEVVDLQSFEANFTLGELPSQNDHAHDLDHAHEHDYVVL